MIGNIGNFLVWYLLGYSIMVFILYIMFIWDMCIYGGQRTEYHSFVSSISFSSAKWLAGRRHIKLEWLFSSVDCFVKTRNTLLLSWVILDGAWRAGWWMVLFIRITTSSFVWKTLCAFYEFGSHYCMWVKIYNRSCLLCTWPCSVFIYT